MGVLNKAYDQHLKEEEHSSSPLAGGIMQNGYQCGMIWGAVLAAGAEVYRLFGSGPEAETRTIIAAQRLVKSFHDLNKNINCFEITEIDKSSTAMQMFVFFLIKGGTIGCFRKASKYAPVAFNEINSVLSEKYVEAPSAPVSCAAVLARKMGVSDLHAVMTSGFAGGIGLCGGACGALGAAIWINGMKNASEQGSKVDFKDPKAVEIVDRFLKHTNYEFECAKIVGRKFENVGDHAEFIKNGGCDKLIDTLARP
ncbi:MAG: C_GCAxxG_C_C family protein [candidate division Zixibacteria bacterium]|nr:C_GCAxxG_C_C family protein [candidate division Zixibacteria bacterium]